MATKRTASAKNKNSMIGPKDTMSGFTIIEVVLVLAIAGLIFMMVFIALPQLQRAQRDTQRRNDFSRLESAITQFQANNNGKIPGQGTTSAVTYNGTEGIESCSGDKSASQDACRLVNVYLNGVNSTENSFIDPDGSPYNVVITPEADAANNAKFDEHKVYIVLKGRCEGETVGLGGQPRDFAIVYRLEGSGTYCQDSGA